MLFSKKKTDSPVVLIHYEGLRGFSQDFPCEVSLENENIIFRNKKPIVMVTLPIKQILSIDFMPETNFMGMYHNTTATTAKMGAKFFYVIKYTSADGEFKFIALWDVGNKAKTLMDAIREKITPSNYML